MRRPFSGGSIGDHAQLSPTPIGDHVQLFRDHAELRPVIRHSTFSLMQIKASVQKPFETT